MHTPPTARTHAHTPTCAEPMTMSAPHSPGGVSWVRASRSVAATTLMLLAWALAVRAC